MADKNWQVFDLEEIKAELKGEQVEYLEFLNVSDLNCGIYSLSAGSIDNQSPHEDDEIYLVLSGKARMKIESTERAVKPGTLIYVKAKAEHRFFEIEEDLTLLVMFATA
jgi:mannose-6-phosphate isomerase-like protein (cupin superfamily)